MNVPLLVKMEMSITEVSQSRTSGYTMFDVTVGVLLDGNRVSPSSEVTLYSAT